MADDIFGIWMAYGPSRRNNQTWFYSNLDTDSRLILNIPDDEFGSITPIENGFKSLGTTRLSIGTSTRYSQTQTTQNHDLCQAQGFMMNRNDFRDMEITGRLLFVNAGQDAKFSIYGRSGDIAIPCEATGYGVELTPDGKVTCAVRQWFPGGVTELDHANATSGDIEAKEITFKLCIYNNPTDTNVNIELWIDEFNNNQFRSICSITDTGKGIFGERCGTNPNQVITWGGPLVIFEMSGEDTETDELDEEGNPITNKTEINITHLSVREIDPANRYGYGGGVGGQGFKLVNEPVTTSITPDVLNTAPIRNRILNRAEEPTYQAGDANKTLYKLTGRTATFEEEPFGERHYASGKPDTVTKEWNIPSCQFDDYTITLYITITDPDDEDDDLSVKLYGPNHSDGNRAWYVFDIEYGSGKTGWGWEDPHPDTSAYTDVGQTVGSIIGKKVGVQVVIWKLPTGGAHMESWFDKGDGLWRKTTDIDNPDGKKFTRHSRQQPQIRLDAAPNIKMWDLTCKENTPMGEFVGTAGTGGGGGGGGGSSELDITGVAGYVEFKNGTTQRVTEFNDIVDNDRFELADDIKSIPYNTEIWEDVSISEPDTGRAVPPFDYTGFTRPTASGTNILDIIGEAGYVEFKNGSTQRVTEFNDIEDDERFELADDIKSIPYNTEIWEDVSIGEPDTGRAVPPFDYTGFTRPDPTSTGPRPPVNTKPILKPRKTSVMIDYGGLKWSNAICHMIFSGSDWNSRDDPFSKDEIMADIKTLDKSTYYDALIQWDIRRPKIGKVVVYNGYTLPNGYDFLDVSELVQSAIEDGVVPPPSPTEHHMYLVFQPYGKVAGDPESGGYHSVIWENPRIESELEDTIIVYGLVKYFTRNHSMQVVTHEIVEMVTDPVTANYDADPNEIRFRALLADEDKISHEWGAEIADVCFGSGETDGVWGSDYVNGAMAQRYYSDQDGKCTLSDRAPTWISCHEGATWNPATQACEVNAGYVGGDELPNWDDLGDGGTGGKPGGGGEEETIEAYKGGLGRLKGTITGKVTNYQVVGNVTGDIEGVNGEKSMATFAGSFTGITKNDIDGPFTGTVAGVGTGKGNSTDGYKTGDFTATNMAGTIVGVDTGYGTGSILGTLTGIFTGINVVEPGGGTGGGGTGEDGEGNTGNGVGGPGTNPDTDSPIFVEASLQVLWAIDSMSGDPCSINSPHEETGITEVFNAPPSTGENEYVAQTKQYRRVGLYVNKLNSVFVGRKLRNLKAVMRRQGVEPLHGFVYCRIRSKNATIVEESPDRIDASQITNDNVTYEWTHDTPGHTIERGDFIYLEYPSGGDNSNFIEILLCDTDMADGEASCLVTYDGANEVILFDKDPGFIISV